MNSPNDFDSVKDSLCQRLSEIKGKPDFFAVEEGPLENIFVSDHSVGWNSYPYNLGDLFREFGKQKCFEIMSQIDEVRLFLKERGYMTCIEDVGSVNGHVVSAAKEITPTDILREIEEVIAWAKGNTGAFTEWLWSESRANDLEDPPGLC